MLNEEQIDEIFRNNQENVEERISKKYHEKIKQIKGEQRLVRQAK